MNVLGIIPARGGSRGVPGKNVRKVLGKPVIRYTIDTAMESMFINELAVTTDDEQIKSICREHYRYQVKVIDRPTELAADKARVDDAMRHCCEVMERDHQFKTDIVVLLYGNVPVRSEGIIDKAINYLIETGAHSVQTITPIGKFHPYWLYRMEGDRIIKDIDNNVYRRQDLPPKYAIDSAVGVVRYEVLMAAEGDSDPHAFWGIDRRGIVQQAEETVDIDAFHDLYVAEAILREKQERQTAFYTRSD